MVVQKEWYTVDEAAEYLGLSRRTVYRLTKEGRLRTHILGKQRTRRFRKADLDNAPQPLETRTSQHEMEDLVALTVATDPVLAELWDNERDAAYDAL